MLQGGRWIDYGNVPGLFDWIVGVLGVIALAATAYQLRRSVNAVSAAQQSYTETRAQFVKAQTIRDITLLDVHVSALRRGSHQTDRVEAQDQLDNFVELGSRLVSLMQLASIPVPTSVDLGELIQAAGVARHELATPPTTTTSIYEQVGPTILKMQEAMIALNSWSTTLQHTDLVPEMKKASRQTGASDHD